MYYYYNTVNTGDCTVPVFILFTCRVYIQQNSHGDIYNNSSNFGRIDQTESSTEKKCLMFI